jgi:hypothetical protein
MKWTKYEPAATGQKVTFGTAVFCTICGTIHLLAASNQCDVASKNSCADLILYTAQHDDAHGRATSTSSGVFTLVQRY